MVSVSSFFKGSLQDRPSLQTQTSQEATFNRLLLRQQNSDLSPPKTPLQLPSLQLSARDFTLQELPKLSSKLQKQVILFLKNQQLPNKAFVQLQQTLQQHPHLNHLILSHTHLNHFAVAALSDLLKVNHFIGWLVLNHSQIDSLRLSELAKGLKLNQGLKHLVLDDNPIGDEGLMTLLKNVQDHPNLESIFLKNCNISKKSLVPIKEFLAKNKQIKRIDLRKSPLSHDDHALLCALNDERLILK